MVRLAYDSKHALNSICPYYTMFPLEFPLGILDNMSNVSSVIDPFCGRGTTLYAARSRHIPAFGLDASPVAVAIAKAKLSSATAEEIVMLAERILCEQEPGDVPEGEFWEWAFHGETLEAICKLRSYFLETEETDATILLRAIILGCLHGPRLSSPSYLSNQMPRTYGSKPNYSVRYWQKRGLHPQLIDPIAVIRKKALRVCKTIPPKIGTPSAVIFGNSEDPNSFTSFAGNHNLVITSPPYYGMRNYVSDQWLRYWFLGGPETVDYSVRDQLSHSSQDAFIHSLSNVWDNIGNSTQPRIDLYIRFGGIPSRKCNPQELIIHSLEKSTRGWRIISITNAATATAGKRQADQMVSGSVPLEEYDIHAAIG